MSKEISKEISKEKTNSLLNCPFCNEELERHCTGRYYMHKLNGCILQHFCFETDDELSIDLWNTRKPLERIVERLDSRRKEYEEASKHPSIELPQECYYKGIMRGYEYSRDIVKEGGE